MSVIKFSRHNVMRVVRNVDGGRAQALRLFMFLLASRLTPFLGVEHDGVRYILSTRESDGVGLWTFVRGGFEAESISRVVAALDHHHGTSTLDGFTVLEVGANIGTETVSLLAHHGVRRVLAVEPDSENVRLLRANLALNGVQDRVQIHELALSDVDGNLTLERSEDNWGDHRIRTPSPIGPDLCDEGHRVTVAIPARRLDSLVDAGDIDLDTIDLVWMDAQGHEAHILAGAERLTTATIPVVTEYWPYGLRRVGALDRFHALIAKHYRLVVDLPPGRDEDDMTLPAKDVAELAARYDSHHGEDPALPHTNLLLLH